MIGLERYSSSVRKKRAGLLGSRTVRIVVIAFFLYLVISRFLVSTFRIDSVSMSPVLNPADKVLASIVSFGPRVPFTTTRLPGFEKPSRGDLVVLQPPFFADKSILTRIAEPLVSFFSFQRGTLYHDPSGGRIQGFVVKRIVGIPGDTLRMRGFVASIRAKGATEFVPETDLPGRGARPLTALSARNWTPELPFSGNGDEIVLKDDEYYVLGDNRPESSDSRSWGPIHSSRILAKVILRYWPPLYFGKL